MEYECNIFDRRLHAGQAKATMIGSSSILLVKRKREAHMSTNVSEQITARQMTPVIFASMAGTAIEWYDFFL
jgi:hypothetical protein